MYESYKQRIEQSFQHLQVEKIVSIGDGWDFDTFEINSIENLDNFLKGFRRQNAN